jgi:hypothetical protein
MRTRSDNITAILDVCLERIRHGESPEACLLDYPDQADELAPLLMAVRQARSLQMPALSTQARQNIRRQLHQAVAARQPAPRRTFAGSVGLFAMRFALVLLVAFLGIGGGVAAAQSSLPGSSLYPLKRASENVRLRLASSPAQRATLHLDFAGARSVEILALVGKEQALDSALVDDLEREYQLAWAELGEASNTEAHDLAKRYLIERQADVKLLSRALAGANPAVEPQLQRAVRLGEQALVDNAPPETPAPPSLPGNGANSGGASGGNQGQGGPGVPGNGGNTDSSSPPKPDNGQSGGNQQAPKATPEGKPSDPGPQATPEGKPSDPGPQATPEGKPKDPGTDPKPKPEPDPKNDHGNQSPGGRP